MDGSHYDGDVGDRSPTPIRSDRFFIYFSHRTPPQHYGLFCCKARLTDQLLLSKPYQSAAAQQHSSFLPLGSSVFPLAQIGHSITLCPPLPPPPPTLLLSSHCSPDRSTDVSSRSSDSERIDGCHCCQVDIVALSGCPVQRRVNRWSSWRSWRFTVTNGNKTLNESIECRVTVEVQLSRIQGDRGMLWLDRIALSS